MANKVYYGEYSLRHWVDLILSENLKLPEYQRLFVWDEDAVKTLMKDFDADNFIPPVTIGSFNDEHGSSNLIIDGQQRLTSILLAYLRLFPDKEKLKKVTNLFDNSSENTDDSDQDVDIENIYEWTFKKLQGIGFTKTEIIQKLKSSKLKDNYIDFDCGITEEDFEKRLDNRHLAFCFLIPEDNTEVSQQKYYSSVFRAINIRGETLLPQESRAALYYLNKEFKQFFDPDFMSGYTININNKTVKIDFVRYLSLISQYSHNKSEQYVARGYKSKLEKYYEQYIYAVINDDDSPIFGKFSILIPKDNYEDRLNSFRKHFSTLWPVTSAGDALKSIIDLDMRLFGLVFYVMFDGKSIKLSEREEILKIIQEKANELRKNPEYAKSPNNLYYLRQRIADSIAIYKEYLENV